MTGTTRSSAISTCRRRRILFRSWHRGIREMDLLMGQFADARIGEMTDAALDIYEALASRCPIANLFRWLTGEAPAA